MVVLVVVVVLFNKVVEQRGVFDFAASATGSLKI
jgi:hypothetical protein